jgi:hypothetical protein
VKSRFISLHILAALLLGDVAPLFAQDRAAVARAQAQLAQAGVPMGGPCGAAKIANLVAWNARPAYGLLWKPGGNRAALKADGSCLGGDDTRDGGFATDYLIDRATGFGYDLLGDGGGANTPQWVGPENDPGIVARNFQNFSEPLDPSAYLRVVVATPPPVVTPTLPAPDQSYSIAVLTQLAAIKLALDAHVLADGDAHASLNQNITDGRNEARPAIEAIKSFMVFTTKYVLPAVAGYFTAKKVG